MKLDGYKPKIIKCAKCGKVGGQNLFVIVAEHEISKKNLFEKIQD